MAKKMKSESVSNKISEYVQRTCSHLGLPISEDLEVNMTVLTDHYMDLCFQIESLEIELSFIVHEHRRELYRQKISQLAASIRLIVNVMKGIRAYDQYAA